MARFQGVDTSRAADVKHRAGQAELGAQERGLERDIAGRERSQELVSSGLGLGAQEQQRQEALKIQQQQMQMQAAQANLELDPKTGKYVATPTRARGEAAQASQEEARASLMQTQAKTAGQVAGLDVQERQQKLLAGATEIEATKVESQAKILAAESRLQSEKNERLKLMTLEENELREYKGTVTKALQSQIEDFDHRIDKFLTGQIKEDDITKTAKLLAAEGEELPPGMEATMNSIRSGNGTPIDVQRIVESLKAQKDQALIKHMAKWGEDEVLDYDTPVMQEFSAFRREFKAIMNLNAASVQSLNAIAPGAIKIEDLWGEGVKGRQEMLNKVSATMFLKMQRMKSAAAAEQKTMGPDVSNATGQLPQSTNTGR